MPRLDRATAHHCWSPDGAALYFLIEDRGRQELFRLGLKDATPGRVAAGGTIGSVRIVARRQALVFAALGADAIRRRCSPSAATVRASARSNRPTGC